MMDRDAWRSQSRLWAHIGTPLRPSADDMRVVADWLQDPALCAPALRAIVLGATPEYHALPWPLDAQVTAVDISPVMLREVWPGPHTLCADWLELPLPEAGIDLVLCDGGLNVLGYPEQQQSLVTALKRVLKPGGLAILRVFTLPERRERLDAIFADLRAGILSGSVARLRIWMALQESPEAGVANGESWRVLGSAEPDVERLAGLLEMDAGYLRTMLDANDTRIYHFPPAATIRRMFCEEPGGFRLEEERSPSYAAGSYCPSYVLRRL